MVTRTKVIEDSHAFRQMADSELNAVLELCELRTYRKGLSVLQEGNERPRGLWIILSGCCAVTSQSPVVGEKQVDFLQPGEVFGEQTFFDSMSHFATVRAVEEAEMVYFPQTALTELLSLEPAAAHQLVLNMGRIMAMKLRQFEERLLSEMVITTTTVPTRVAVR